jgi:hypothetical protein
MLKKYIECFSEVSARFETMFRSIAYKRQPNTRSVSNTQLVSTMKFQSLCSTALLLAIAEAGNPQTTGDADDADAPAPVAAAAMPAFPTAFP